ncbi:methionine adenosyltransferase [Patescibacteria group bacterium]|nr:methionine adenosyltransferase [Patescibacteria group bacterium]
MYRQFTSESVAAGHPDKICDQISDAIVDEALSCDPKSRVAVETLVTKNRVVLAGEVTCSKNLDYESIARNVIKQLGYVKDEYEFSHRSHVDVYIHEQSPDITQGVESGGAGDQGMMFGYATRETRELMPLPIAVAHSLVKALDAARIAKAIPYLRPDGKAEVVVDYDNGKPVGIATVIIAVPHDPKVKNNQLVSDVEKLVVYPVIKKYSYTLKVARRYTLIVNGTGRWEIGGPASDTGLTGRKIIVDTYGGMGRHGGGCFSGKDPTKVDRSGAYATRFLAKNIVAAGLADRCEVKVAYVIGRAKPVSMAIQTFGTEEKRPAIIHDFAKKTLDLAVPNILEKLSLRRPIYRQTAVYGHFGNEAYPWEKIVP